MTATYAPEQRLKLFPLGTQLSGEGDQEELTLASCRLQSLAEEYGTPLYLYDRRTLDQAVRDYQQALNQYYAGPASLTYAGKAFLCLAIAQWAAKQGLTVDCTGAGEIAIAAAAGVPRSQILVHGVNKNPEDLAAALQYAGIIVVDNLHELHLLLDRLSHSVAKHGELPALWLRLRPGLAVETHGYTQTGQEDSKFGLAPAEFLQAVQLCVQQRLPLVGLHFHQGSHFHDPSPLVPALALAFDLIEEARQQCGWLPSVLSPGGGWGVPYHEDDLPFPPLTEYVRCIAEQVEQHCQQRRLPRPHLQLEPGRSLVARAGVALYRVGTVKYTPHRRYLLLDGGMADNPRVALYGARYTALPVLSPHRPSLGPAWLAGPYCESGDVLIQDLPLPDVQPGELLAIPVSGAYHLSMSSNYNGARRPAVLWLENGQAHLVQKRETLADLHRRDLPLPEQSLA